jgi:hypothetical protein
MIRFETLSDCYTRISVSFQFRELDSRLDQRGNRIDLAGYFVMGDVEVALAQSALGVGDPEETG